MYFFDHFEEISLHVDYLIDDYFSFLSKYYPKKMGLKAVFKNPGVTTVYTKSLTYPLEPSRRGLNVTIRDNDNQVFLLLYGRVTLHYATRVVYIPRHAILICLALS